MKALDSAAVLIFVVVLVELTNTVFVNSTNISTNIETAVLSKKILFSKNCSEDLASVILAVDSR